MQKPIGDRIKERRSKLGITRDSLGARVGVTGQTILNLEQDPTYNLGTRLLQRIGEELGVEFEITMKEKTAVKKNIRMGTDELILHIRKHYNCTARSDVLANQIGNWLRHNADAEQVLPKQYQAPYMIGLPKDVQIPAVDITNLPKGGVIFDFRPDMLAELFAYLAQLGGTPKDQDEYAHV